MSSVVEIKTGKVLPYVSLQLAAQLMLLESPDAVDFNREEHIYTRAGVILPSITQVLVAEGIIDTAFYTEEGRHRGKMVHLACHLFDTAQISKEEIDSETEPYLRAWISFKRDTGFTVIDSEKPLASKLYGYAGTPDRVGEFSWPTGNHPRRMAVELHDDGAFKIFPYNDPADFQIFLSILAVHNYKKRR